MARNPKFKVGDRVQRPVDVFNERSKLRHGVIITRYADYVSRFGPYPELYEVRWDDGEIQRAFLPHGLDPEMTQN